MNLTLRKDYISILIIQIILCSLFFSCTSTQSDKMRGTVLNEHEMLNKRPCWLKKAPEDCEKIKNIKGSWIFFVDHIVTRKESEEMTEQQRQLLQTQINSQYIEKLESKIISKIKYHTECINEDTKDQCDALFQAKLKLISQGTVQANEIEICKIFWEKSNTHGEYKLFGLGKFDKKRYLDKLSLVLDGKSHLPTKKPIPIQTSKRQLAYSISSPSEMTDLFDTPAKIYWDDLEENETCNDIKIQYTDLPKQITYDGCVSTIQNEFKKIYLDRTDNGKYIDHRILETNNECMKKGEGCNVEHDYVGVEDEMEKEYNRTVSCWQSKIKQLEAEYINKKKEALLAYKDTHHNVTRFNHILYEWSYEMDVQIKNDEEKKLIDEMYQQKEKLLNTYYLVLTIANSGHQPTNSRVIRKFSIKLAKNELLKHATTYNILKNILLENGTLKYEDILANFNIRIMPDHFNQLKIIPRQFIAKVMKFKAGVSSSSTKLLSAEELSELTDLKTKSFIIAGNEDIVLNDRFEPTNQVQLKEESYQSWKEIAFKKKITVEEDKRNSIQELINEVIDANIKAKQTAIRYQNEYLAEKEEMNKKIQNNTSNIQKLNAELFSMLHKRNVLPFTVEGQNHKESILSDVKQRYLTYLHQVASQKERTIDGLNNVQPKIFQLLVDSSLDYDDEFVISQASKKIATVFKDNQEEFCSGALHGSIGIRNNKQVNNKSFREGINAVLVGYHLPVIKIKPEYDNEQARLSLPIMLKIRCESIQISFKYDSPNNVILDYATNIQWKVKENRYPRKRNSDKDEWYFPSLNNPKEVDQYMNDYHKFCLNYNNFYQAISNKYIYQNYPELTYIKRFSVEKNNQDWIIKDMLRQEEWKLIENINYNDLLVRVRHTNWIVNTSESLEVFFNELKSNFKRDKVNNDIVNMLSNKNFWTSTDISTRTKATIMLDFNQGKSEEEAKVKESKCVGIVTRKTRGF